MNICMFGSGTDKIDDKYKDVAYDLGANIGKHNHNLIYGGGSNGLMGNVARGASDYNAHITSIMPEWMLEFETMYEKSDEIIYTKTIKDRKKLFLNKSDAFIVLAGGMGTLDELTEVIILKKLRRHNKPIIIVNSYHFYDDLVKLLDDMIEEHAMAQDNALIYHVVPSIDEAFDYIAEYNFDNHIIYEV